MEQLQIATTEIESNIDSILFSLLSNNPDILGSYGTLFTKIKENNISDFKQLNKETLQNLLTCKEDDNISEFHSFLNNLIIEEKVFCELYHFLETEKDFVEMMTFLFKFFQMGLTLEEIFLLDEEAFKLTLNDAGIINNDKIKNFHLTLQEFNKYYQNLNDEFINFFKENGLFNKHKNLIKNLIQAVEPDDIFNLDEEALKIVMNDFVDIDSEPFHEFVQNLNLWKEQKKLTKNEICHFFLTNKIFIKYIEILKIVENQNFTVEQIFKLNREEFNTIFNGIDVSLINDFYLVLINKLFEEENSFFNILKENNKLYEFKEIIYCLSQSEQKGKCSIDKINKKFFLGKGVNCEESIINKFLSIIELEIFFNSSDFDKESKAFINLNNNLIKNDVGLEKLKTLKSNSVLDTFIFLFTSDLFQFFSKESQDMIYEQKINLDNLMKFSEDQLKNDLKLSEDIIKLLKNSFNVVNFLRLRNVHFLELEFSFFSFLCKNIFDLNCNTLLLSKETEFSESYEKILKKENKAELFLKDIKYDQIADDIFKNAVKCMTIEELKKCDLNFFIKIQSKTINANKSKKLIEILKTYDEKKLDSGIDYIFILNEKLANYDNLIINYNNNQFGEISYVEIHNRIESLNKEDVNYNKSLNSLFVLLSENFPEEANSYVRKLGRNPELLEIAYYINKNYFNKKLLILKEILEKRNEKDHDFSTDFFFQTAQEENMHKILINFNLEFEIFQFIAKFIEEELSVIYYKKMSPLFDLFLISNNNSQQLFNFFKKIKFEEVKLSDKLEELTILLSTIGDNNYEFLQEIYKKIPAINNIVPIRKSRDQVLKEEIIEIDNLLSRYENQKKYTFKDLLEINYNWNADDLKHRIIKLINSKSIITEEIVKLFFDSIKRKESIDETFREISTAVSNKVSFKLNHFNLLNYILKNSDSNLKIILLNICSKFMPVPFLSSVSNIDNDLYNLNSELSFIFNDKTANILSFCLSKDTTNYPKGKSHLLNFCFGMSFLTNEDDLSKFGNSEIQMDHHYANPMNMCIVDFHGVPTSFLIKRISNFFNYFFIHINDFENFNDEIMSLFEDLNGSQIVVIIFIHQKVKLEEGIYVEKKDNILTSFHTVKINQIRKMTEKPLKNLKDVIWGVISKNNKLVEKNNTKKSYLNICSKFNDDNVDFLRRKIRTIDDFIEFLCKFKNDFTQKEFLPLNHKFIKYSARMREIYSKTSNYTEENEKELKKLYNNYKSKEDLSPVAQLFIEMVNDEYFIGNLIDSSHKLKMIVESELIEPMKLRKEIIQKLTSQISKDEKGKLENQKSKVFDSIIKKSFSYEFITRELYHDWRISQLNKCVPNSNFKEFTQMLISNGQPFEIIDGDNLHFISDIYQEIFEYNNDKVLVVSVIGPQSSGKSTLLNFIFGTQFASSSGRCTKGMYGAILDIKNHPRYEKLLILDSEGIQSAERNDPLFDKKLILYCLCVSHVTIICNKGDIHKGMTELLKLTISLMAELKESKQIKPDIFVVLNALTDINEEKLWEPLNKLLEDLFNRNENIKDVINLTDDNVIMLPFAFETKDIYSQIKANIPSYTFSKQCSNLKMKILNQFKNGEMSNNNYSIQEWFKFAQSFWEKIDKFRSIIDYSCLEEIHQDKRLVLIISELLESFMTILSDDSKNINNNKLNDICSKYLANCNTLDQLNFALKNVYIDIENLYTSESDKLLSKYRDECEELNITNIDLMEKRKTYLLQNTRKILEDWKSKARDLLHKKKVEISKCGMEELNKEINRLILENNNSPYSTSNAEKLFEIFWENEILEKIKKTLPDKHKIQDESYDLVKKCYYNSTNDMLHDPQLEKDLKNFSSSMIFAEVIKIMKNTDSIFFDKKLIPNLEEIIHLQQIKNTYFNFPYVFDMQENYKLYGIDIKNGFKYNSLLIKLNKLVKDNLNSWLNYGFKTYESSFKKELQKVFKEIENDCKKGFKLNYDEFSLTTFSKRISKIKDEVNKNKNKTNTIIEQFSKEICDFVLNSFSAENIKEVQPSYKSEFVYFNPNILYVTGKEINYTEAKKYENDPFYHTKNSVISIINKEFKNNSFLHWYINPNDNNNIMYESKVQEGRTFVEKYIDWTSVLKDILTSVYKCCAKDIQVGNIKFSEEINMIQSFLENTESNILNKYGDLTSRTITNLIQEVNFIINDLNKYIKPMRWEITSTMRGKLHTIAMSFLGILHSHLEHYKSYEPLRMNLKCKAQFKNLFVHTLTKNDAEQDKSLSELIFKDNIIENINLWATSEAQNIFCEEMKQELGNIKPDHAMKILDDILMNDNNKDYIIKIILQPREVLKEMFQDFWNRSKEKCYKKAIERWIILYESKLLMLLSSFGKFYEELKSANLLVNSVSLFKGNFESLESSVGGECAQESREDIFKLCTAKYLTACFKKTWDNKGITTESFLIEPIRPFPLFIDIADENLKTILIDKLQNQKIWNIEIFLRTLITKTKEELNVFHNKIPDAKILDKAGQEKEFENLFIGCNVHCDLCGRKCDENHARGIDRHSCKSGHRFKAFGGSIISNRNLPSFKSCDEMEDKDIIIFNGQELTWKEYKVQISKKWDFTADKYKQESNLEKNNNIWSRVGKRVCEHYSKIKKIPMNYIDYEEYLRSSKIKTEHLILVLDDSGSMSGTPWIELKESVGNLFKYVITKSNPNVIIKVSIVLHNFEYPIVKKQNIDLGLLDLLGSVRGGTYFKRSLEIAYNLIIESKDEFDCFRLAFMSDGYDNHPQSIIDTINLDKEKIKSRILINTLLFGNCPIGKQTLTRIAMELNGTFTQTLDMVELSNAFKEILNKGF